jgi:uncharacterized membrane protein YdjX (TVP38/TMEM64 family)
MLWQWIGLGIIALVVFIAWFFLPLGEWIQSFNDWIDSLGIWGGLVFVAVYIVATILLAPGSVFTVAGGFVFGLAWGFPLVVTAATIGASLAFLIARYLARDRIKEFVARKPRFNAVDRAVSDEGWKVVALLRLSPLVPFNLQNYFFGLTEVKLWHYVLATFFGIIPGALLYLYVGAIGKAAAGSGVPPGSGGILQWVFFGVGLIATAVVAILVTRKAKAKLEKIGVDDRQ